MQGSYKWGILAPGKIAHKFAIGLQSVPGATIHAVGSRDISRADQFASQYDIPVSYGSYQELVSDPDVDVIYIATPHTFHMENTLLCLNHGKAVICEKPLAINSQQVSQMIQAAVSNNTFLMEALWSRFLPNIIKTKQLIEQGAIGEVSHLEADFGFKAKYDVNSRLYAPNLGGGALLDIGIYPLFFALYLFGQPVTINSKSSLAETGVDESGEVNLVFDGGKTARLTYTIAADTPVEAQIVGAEGTIKLPNRWYQPVNLFTIKNQQPIETEFDFTGNGYNYQAMEVQKCLELGKIESQLWSHQDSLLLMQSMDEIRRQCGIRYPMDELSN